MSNKANQVGIRCTEEQRQLWEQAAAADRRTLTDWIRIQLDDAAEKALERSQEKTSRKK